MKFDVSLYKSEEEAEQAVRLILQMATKDIIDKVKEDYLAFQKG